MVNSASIHCLEGRVQACFEASAAVRTHDTRQRKLLCVKKTKTNTDYCQSLSEACTQGTI